MTRKVRITIRLDADVVRWFKEQVEAVGGGNYQPLINTALRAHIEGQKESSRSCFAASFVRNCVSLTEARVLLKT